jgi:predicted MPP superfamily phosphohydrolase
MVVVKKYQIAIPNWPAELNGLKLAIITDLHFGSWKIIPAKVAEVVALTNREEPDLILLLGDFVSSKKDNNNGNTYNFAQYLAPLSAKLGVYAVLGNHDWWYDGELIHRQLERVQIKVLENSNVQLHYRGRTLWLAGIPDFWTRHPDPVSLLSNIPEQDSIIALTHNPDIFPKVPSRVNLTLAGHTHGGQVAIPFFGPLILPSKYGQRYAKGHIVENGKHLFVSTGIGTSILPIRFLVPPEISILTLTGCAP